MPTHPVSFANALGVRLEGRLETPVGGAARATALFAHCFGCTKDVMAAVRVSRALAARGFAVLRFDFTGLGASEGDEAATTFATNADDVVAAARFLEEAHGAPALLVGHSRGGAAVIAAASRIPSARAVATIGAPASVPGQGAGERAGLRDPLRTLPAGLLLLHAPDDAVVPVEDAARLYTAAPHPKSFVALPGADHLLSATADAEYAAAVIAAWAERYLPESPAHPSETAPGAGVTVTTPAGGYATEIVARGHRIVADEPRALGGDDTGPTPYELLVGALGACTSITLQMYARRKGWPLRAAMVRLRHARTHAADCADCAEQEVGLQRVERQVELEGDLSDEQRARLLQIADRCPLHRTLSEGLRVVPSAPSAATSPPRERGEEPPERRDEPPPGA